MERAITWYEVLGVLPGAKPDKIRQKYDDRTGLLRGEMLAGAPSHVLAMVTRGQNFLDTAWAILGDPGSRGRYDEAAGFRRKGLAPSGSFATGSWHHRSAPEIVGDLDGGVLSNLLALAGPSPGSRSRSANRARVPDLRGLFYDVSMEVAGRLGLRIRSVQLTARPMPIDGLVVDQAPRPGGKLRRDETLMAHVWHPPIRSPGSGR
ncbi:MAG: hypothetical protein ABSB59_18240 [Streptosporangiaceae bacterium]|jgi:hypothetical protein